MLNRWALLALVPFILLQIFRGWPDVRERFGTSDAALPFFTVQVVGAVFFTLLVAWIAYRLGGRSQYAASVVFVAFMFIFSANVFLQVCGFYFTVGPDGPGKPFGSSQQPWKEQTEFPSFGFAVKSPGWAQSPPREKRVIAWWGSPDSSEGDIRAMVDIQWETAVSRTLAERAQAAAQSLGGRVEEEQLLLDGEPALRIRAPAANSGLKPVEVIVTQHNGLFVMIIGAVTPGRTCHEQVEAICKSWKWIKKAP